MNDRNVWIGYTDERIEGMFEWLDGSAVSLLSLFCALIGGPTFVRLYKTLNVYVLHLS